MESEKRKVIFYEVFDEERVALEAVLSSEVAAVFIKDTIQEAGYTELPASIISIRTQSIIPNEWAEKVTGILTRSAGIEHVIAYLKRNNISIACGYLPSYCAYAVAEQAIIVVMALWRKLPLQIKNMEMFDRDGLTGRESREKNLLIIGVGKIGKECIKIGQALGMNVKGVDIDPREEDVEYVGFNEGIKWADAIVSAVPLTKKTQGMFDCSVFQLAKKECIFVNVSRGEVSPLAEIKRALECGALAGAGIDVYDNEASFAAGLRADSEGKESISLKQLKKYNVILTPHNAFNTHEAVERKAKQSADSIKYFLKTGRFIDEIFRQ